MVIGFTLVGVLFDPKGLVSSETVESWAVAPDMIIAFIPFLYGVSWYASVSNTQAVARLTS